MMLSIVHLRARCSALYKPVERLIYQALTIKERQRDMNAKRFISYAALVAGVFILNGRLNAAVESDVVGYSKVTMKPGYNMVGITYNGLDGKDVPFTKAFSGDFADEDMVMVYSPTGYKSYVYAQGTWYDATDFHPLTDDDCLAVGTTLWMVIPNREVEVTFTGSVKADDTIVAANSGATMLVNPYPSAVALKDVSFGRSLTDDDQIQVPKDGSSYDVYIYNGGTWYDATTFADAGMKEIPAGKAFWLFLNAGNDVEFVSPLKK